MINVFISIIIKTYPVVFVVTGATKKVAAGAEVPAAGKEAEHPLELFRNFQDAEQ